MTTGIQNNASSFLGKIWSAWFPNRTLLTLTVMGLLSGVPAVVSADEGHHELLTGDRVLLSTVQEIRGGQARVSTGEISPRFLPMNVRKDKGLPELKKGDRVEITLNDQNLIVDIHLVGEASHHQIIRGKLVQPLITGHEKAVIRTDDGNEESHLVRPLARSKVASVPVGAKAVFLIDERNGIADVTYESKEAVTEAQRLWEKKTPLKASFSRVPGVIQKPLDTDFISIKTAEGQDHSYKVRPLIQKKFGELSVGKMVVLFVDEENMVTDVSISSPEIRR